MMPSKHEVIDAQGNLVSRKWYDDNGAEITEQQATTQATNGDTLRSRARASVAANNTYLGLSAAQKTANQQAHVDRLTKECTALIKLLLGDLDTADGT